MSRLLRTVVCSLGCLAILATPSEGQNKKAKAERIAIADPAMLKDDPDFAIQGEYVGSSSDGKETWGAQVIARGDGKFEVKFLSGGLPGAGADGKVEKMAVANRTASGVVVQDKDKVIARIEGDVMKNVDPKGFPLKKIARSSPTLGAKPPAGATVLFLNSEDLQNWDNGKITELSDGKFLAASSVRSKKTFQSFRAHIEFRLAWMPKSTGQARSNSGVYVQDRYEVQVLDSFGLKGFDNECGGIYKESSPKVNMCLPPMVWQTYDIDFTAAKFDAAGKKVSPAVITVRHNGVTIHDKLQLNSNTPGGKFAKETPEPGALYFQNHGDPVVFRNIWVEEVK